jgi:NarL family two-component system response regulator LiaR
VLTVREREVLRHVAIGESNQEIAEQLVLSLATVKRHVSNIFDKLQVSSRTQAAVRAREMRLL